jgi:hypothetical protein
MNSFLKKHSIPNIKQDGNFQNNLMKNFFGWDDFIGEGNSPFSIDICRMNNNGWDSEENEESEEKEDIVEATHAFHNDSFDRSYFLNSLSGRTQLDEINSPEILGSKINRFTSLKKNPLTSRRAQTKVKLYEFKNDEKSIDWLPKIYN